MKKTSLNTALCLLLAGVLLLSCTSCTLSVKAAELSAGYTRKAAEQGAVDDTFISAMADFSMKLFRETVTKDSKNDLVSPLSTIVCLAMLANGADGSTRTQMEQAFGMDVKTLNEQLYAYTNGLYSSGDCKINLANSIWICDSDSTLQVKESFLQANADWYRAQIYGAPFDETTLKDMNTWAKQNTDGMIDHILDEILPNTVMYLINALVFDAKWEAKYERKDISDGIFTNYNNTEETVSMMKSEERIWMSGENFSGFAKNYKNGKYSFVGLLPNDGEDVYEFADSLTGERWLQLWNGRTADSVTVRFPEFTCDVGMDLNDALRSMGMTDMFDARSADFSKITSEEPNGIYCDFVRQKTYIEVSRNGTKAAAVTWGALRNKEIAMATTLNLDRPFVYAVVDNATGLPLFAGIVASL